MAAAQVQGLGKRGRESWTPAEQWRQLARTVPGALLLVATSEADKVLTCLDSAHRRLLWTMAVDLLEIGRKGNPPQRPSGRSVPASYGEVARLGGLHAAAGHLFALCAERLGLPRGDDAAGARWRAWDGRRSEAARHADEALRRLRSTMTDLQAAAQVLVVLQSRPPESPPRVAWTSEAEQLVRHAVGEVAAARDAVRRMRDAVFLEFFAAWAVLTSHR
ncbi:hypothetical protein ACP70R_031127 [Stipagrostis hirtigluma subsp. patula]